MLLSGATSARSTQLVKSCGLDSLSIFFSARMSGSPSLTYLFHKGVSEGAQHAYMHGKVFEDDPFTTIIDKSDRCGHLIRWGDKRLERAAGRANAYRHFINCHAIEVVGAWVQQVLPDFYLVIGAHCCPGGHERGNVPMRLLEHEAAEISQLVVGELLEAALAGRTDSPVFQTAIARVQPQQAAPLDCAGGLTAREMEIAHLVGMGKQNKQIAFLTGISEYTVENHLRKIYRKLGVHNRTGMAARMFGDQTCQ